MFCRCSDCLACIAERFCTNTYGFMKRFFCGMISSHGLPIILLLIIASAVLMPNILHHIRRLAVMANSSSDAISGVYSVAYVTAPSKDVATTLAEGLVKNKLAACVNIIPGISSVYEWKEEIQHDSEVLMMIKTRTSKVENLTNFVREHHPYEVCEVISTPIQHGNPPYLKWLGEVMPDK